MVAVEVMVEAVQAAVMPVVAHPVAMRALLRVGTLPPRVATAVQVALAAALQMAVRPEMGALERPAVMLALPLTLDRLTRRVVMVVRAVLAAARQIQELAVLVVKVPMVVLRMQKLIQAMQQQMAVRVATVARAELQMVAETMVALVVTQVQAAMVAQKVIRQTHRAVMAVPAVMAEGVGAPSMAHSMAVRPKSTQAMHLRNQSARQQATPQA